MSELQELPYNFVSSVTNLWMNICTPIYVKNPKETISVVSIGTGFITRYKGKIFFITAKHVLDEMKKNDYIILNLNNQVISLEYISFHFDKEHDVAVAYFSDEWLIERGLKSLKAIDLSKNFINLKYLNTSILLGFPATRNKLSKRFDKKDRFGIGFGLYEKINEPSSATELLNPITFSFDPEDALDENFQKANRPPHLKGMSGSPFLGIYLEEIRPDNFEFKVKIEGVFLECYPKKKEERSNRNIN